MGLVWFEREESSLPVGVCAGSGGCSAGFGTSVGCFLGQLWSGFGVKAPVRPGFWKKKSSLLREALCLHLLSQPEH